MDGWMDGWLDGWMDGQIYIDIVWARISPRDNIAKYSNPSKL